MNPSTPHLTPEQLSERWGFCLETIRRMLRRKEIPALKIGRSWRIPMASVEEYERNATSGALVPPLARWKEQELNQAESKAKELADYFAKRMTPTERLRARWGKAPSDLA